MQTLNELEPKLDTETKQNIINAISFLSMHGYHVVRDYDYLVGKWVAFHKEGMYPILHGKIVEISNGGVCSVKTKNGQIRYVHIKHIHAFFDTKTECYSYK